MVADRHRKVKALASKQESFLYVPSALASLMLTPLEGAFFPIRGGGAIPPSDAIGYVYDG